MESLHDRLDKEIDKNYDRLAMYSDYYTEDLFRQSKNPKALLRKARGEILMCSDRIAQAVYVTSLFDKVHDFEDNLTRLLNIITLYAHNSINNKLEYAPKTYQYIRDYNGVIKVTAKQYPPGICKGTKRNKELFKTYDMKLNNSISRSKQKVYELARCNDWQYYATFTINKERYDRYDLEVYMKSFVKWLSNYSARKTNGRKITYILIPEIGKDGAWHLHGLINGLPSRHLSPFVMEKHPRWLIRRKYRNWKAYEVKFGFCSFGKIRDKEKVAGYITKFLRASSKTKERKLHSRLFYSSKGLKRSTEVCRGYDLVPIDTYDFENEYVGIKWFDYDP